MYILFEMVDQRLMGPIQIKGRWLEYCIGFIPDSHAEIIAWSHLNATVLTENVAEAWMFTQGWSGQISVRAGTPQDEQLVIHESTEDLSVKEKYTLTDDDKSNCIAFMQAVMRKKLDKIYDVRLDNANLSPSKLEGESWERQKAEAQAGGGPMLQALATTRGITEAEMVTLVINAMDSHNQKIQDLLSAKQAIEKEIKDSTTMESCWLLLHNRFNLHAPVLLLQDQGVSTAPALNL